MIDGDEYLPELSEIFKEGRDLARARKTEDLMNHPELFMCEEHECPYRPGTLSEMAFMFGFASAMVGVLAGVIVILKDQPKHDYKPSDN